MSAKVGCPYCASAYRCYDVTGMHARQRQADFVAALRFSLPARCKCGNEVRLAKRPFRWLDPDTGEPCRHRKPT